MVLNPVELYHSPSPKPPALPHKTPALDASGAATPGSPSEKSKRVSRACDVCRINHRKCPGPQPGSNDCQRCIKQCKTCTWSDFVSRSPRLTSASASPKSARSRGLASTPTKLDRRRQASVSTSPKPPRPRKIKIRRSESVPSTQLAPAPATHNVPLIDKVGSPASSLTSDDESSDPGTPALPQQAVARQQPFSLDPHMQTRPAGERDLDEQQPRFPSYTTSKDPTSQSREAEVLPEWYKDCLAVANKHDLLLFPVPLSSWEDRQLRGKTSKLDTGLQFVVPSYVDPPATKKEVLDLLDVLLVEERTLPFAKAASQAIGQKSIWAPRDEAAELTSGDEPYRLATSRDKFNDAPSSSTPPSSPRIFCTPPLASNQTTPPSPLPCQGSSSIVQSVEIIVDDEDEDENMSEPEPDFSCDFFADAPNSSPDVNVSPYRHKAGRDRFEAFLLSPCQCQLSPAPRFGASLARAIDVTFEDEKAKAEEAFWDEGMPDVLAEASHEMALDECLRVEQVSRFD